MRENTRKRKKQVVKTFLKLLRSGKSYSAEYMYKEAGKSAFVSPERARAFVNDHVKYCIINYDMVYYTNLIAKENRRKQRSLFSAKFNVCPREATLLMHYIKRGINENR